MPDWCFEKLHYDYSGVPVEKQTTIMKTFISSSFAVYLHSIVTVVTLIVTAPAAIAADFAGTYSK